MFTRCCIKNCGSRRKTSTLHAFPARQLAAEKWVQQINRAKVANLDFYELNGLYVCEKHFEKRFANPVTRHLRSGAYPSLFTEDEIASGLPAINEDDGTIESSTTEPSLIDINTDHNYHNKRQHHDHTYSKLSEASSVPFQIKTCASRSGDMGIFRCCVDGCESQRKDTQLFNIPTQDKLRDVWLKLLIPTTPSLANLTKEQLVQRKVCQLHFEQKYLQSGNRRKKLAFPTLFTEDEIFNRTPATQINILWQEEGNLSHDHTYSTKPTHASLLNLPKDDATSLGNKLKALSLDHNYSECTYKARKLLLVSADGEPYEVPNNNVTAVTQNDHSRTSMELKMDTKKKQDAYKIKHRIIDEIKESDLDYQIMKMEKERARVQMQQTMFRFEESEDDIQRRLILEAREQELKRNLLRLQRDEEPRERARQLLRQQLGLHRPRKTRNTGIDYEKCDDNDNNINSSRKDTDIVKEGSDNIHEGKTTYNLTRSVPRRRASDPKYGLQNISNNEIDDSLRDLRYKIVKEGLNVSYYFNDEEDITQGSMKALDEIQALNEEIDNSSEEICNNEFCDSEDVNYVEYDGIVNKTELSYDEDFLGDYDLDGGICGHNEEQPRQDGPFSWQKFTEDAVPLDGQFYDEDDVKFCGESQLVPDLCDPSDSPIQEEFSCNVCNEAITGCRYCCVACPDWDLCGACEARGEHGQHYVLRVPHGKTYIETQLVLAALRRLLEDLVLHEDPNVNIIKDEVKTEDPLGDIDTESQEPDEVLEHVVNDTGQLSGDMHEEIENEHLDNNSDTSVTTIEDTESIIEVPTDTVPTTHKRKILHTVDSNIPKKKKKQKQKEPRFVFHYDQNKNQMSLVDQSQSSTEVSTDKYIVVPQIDGGNFTELQTDNNGFIALQTENDIITQRETDNFIELPLETGEVIRLQVDNDYIAPQTDNDVLTETETDNFIELPSETGELIRLQVDNDFIAPQIENDVITQRETDNFIELPFETGEVIRLQVDNDYIAPQTENDVLTETETDNFIELPLETGEVIRLQVDNFYIAPQTENDVLTQAETDNFIELPLETDEVIRLQVDNDFIAPQSETSGFIVLDDNVLKNIVQPSESVVIQCPNESSLTEIIEMSSLADCTGTNDVRYMTLDGQLLDVIDCSKELRVNLTRLSENKILAATRGRRVKRRDSNTIDPNFHR